MIRTAAMKTLLLAAATLTVGALAVNCSHNDKASTSDIGSVGMAITLPNGAIVSTVHYSLRNSANVEVRSNDIATTDPGATVSVALGGVPAGTGYTILLTAMASDGTSCSGTSSPFAVVANMTAQANILLLCRGVVTNGTVIVNGQIDNCPVVTSFAVSPLAVAAGGTINVSAAASDADPSDMVSLKWTAPAGSFQNPAAGMTLFTCPAASTQVTLTITASDSNAPGTTTPKCSTPATITVNCGLCGDGTVQSSAGETCDPPNGTTCDSACHTITIACGNGVVQPGEQCDPPNGTTCNASCQNIAVACGNNIVQPGEQCDPPNGTTCSATCQNIAIACGNNIVQPGEQCDPPNGTTCNAACKNIVCGDGIKEGTEQCDPPNGTTCSATCTTIAQGSGGAVGTGSGGAVGSGGVSGSGGSQGAGGAAGGGITAACQTCEAQQCAVQGFGCNAFSGAAQASCNAALSCFRTTHCDPLGDTSICYCGTASQEDGSCVAQPLGACFHEMEAADPNILATDSQAVRVNKMFADLVDVTLPVGNAGLIVGCDAFSCNAANQCAGQF